jgi:hypothetical protein
MSKLRKIGAVTFNHYEARIYRDAEWEEWRVKLYIHGNHQKDADYHTNDKSDACHTAEAMVSPGGALNTVIQERQGL